MLLTPPIFNMAELKIKTLSKKSSKQRKNYTPEQIDIKHKQLKNKLKYKEELANILSSKTPDVIQNRSDLWMKYIINGDCIDLLKWQLDMYPQNSVRNCFHRNIKKFMKSVKKEKKLKRKTSM